MEKGQRWVLQLPALRVKRQSSLQQLLNMVQAIKAWGDCEQ